MYRIFRNRKISSNTSIIIVVCFFILMICCFGNNRSDKSSLEGRLTDLSSTISVLSRITKEVFSGVNPESRQASSEKTKKDNTKEMSCNMLHVFNSLLVMSKNKNCLRLMILSIMLLVGIKKTAHIRKSKILLLIKNKFYLCWRNMFLTPEEKCLKARSEEYDINPLKMQGMVLLNTVEKARTLFTGIKCGFFNV